jgi:hypothetical protein
MSFGGTDDSLGYQQFTVVASTGVTMPANVTPNYWIFVAEAQAVRWRDDGVAPTATVGMTLAVGVPLRYDSKNINKLRFIEATSGGIVNATAYGNANA